MEFLEELPSEMQSKDKSLAPYTTISTSPPSVSLKTCPTMSPMPLLESSTSNPSHQEEAKESNEPQEASATSIEPQVIPGSSMILDVYPSELHFPFEPNKLILCSLHLTNNTSEEVIFGLNKKSNDQTCFLKNLPMYGILAPKSTYTLVVTTSKFETLPIERSTNLIMQYSINGVYTRGARYTCNQHFQEVIDLGDTVHEVTLKAVCDPQVETTFEAISPLIKIISVDDTEGITSIDANQTEPLIIVGHKSGHVHIWNYDTKKSIGSFDVPGGPVRSVKFIARKQWFLVGSNDGRIHVYKYNKKVQKVTIFEASRSEVCSLAVHPTQPYVLSGCRKQTKLWHWGLGWKCIRTFVHSDSHVVCAVAFNPVDTNSFACASRDGTIKVWSLDSTESKYTIEHLEPMSSLDFFTRDGRRYLLSGCTDGTAKIWDMQKGTCVRTLKTPNRSAVTSVVSHPSLPLLVTGTHGGVVYLWSSTNFRLQRILNIGGLSRVQGLACLIESGRVVVAHQKGVSVIEIRDEGNPKPTEDCGYSAAADRHRLGCYVM